VSARKHLQWLLLTPRHILLLCRHSLGHQLRQLLLVRLQRCVRCGRCCLFSCPSLLLQLLGHDVLISLGHHYLQLLLNHVSTLQQCVCLRLLVEVG
jgi:hypothetical protein